MRFLKLAACFAFLSIVFAGCRSPEMASFKREVVVKKDAQNNVVETLITESVTQEYLTSKVYFQYVTPRQGDANFIAHGGH